MKINIQEMRYEEITTVFSDSKEYPNKDVYPFKQDLVGQFMTTEKLKEDHFKQICLVRGDYNFTFKSMTIIQESSGFQGNSLKNIHAYNFRAASVKKDKIVRQRLVVLHQGGSFSPEKGGM